MSKNLKTTQSVEMGYNPFIHNPPTEGQIFTEPSLTIPDETMSLREIINRFQRGIPYTAPGGIPIYDDLEDPNDFQRHPRTMDYTEIHEEINEIRSKQKFLKKESEINNPKPEEDVAGRDDSVRNEETQQV